MSQLIAALLQATTPSPVPSPAESGAGGDATLTIAVIGAVTGVIGTVLGGYGALNAAWSKRAKIDPEIRRHLDGLLDALAVVKAQPADLRPLDNLHITAATDAISEASKRTADRNLRNKLERIPAKCSDAAKSAGRGPNASIAAVNEAHQLVDAALARLNMLQRRAPA